MVAIRLVVAPERW